MLNFPKIIPAIHPVLKIIQQNILKVRRTMQFTWLNNSQLQILWKSLIILQSNHYQCLPRRTITQIHIKQWLRNRNNNGYSSARSKKKMDERSYQIDQLTICHITAYLSCHHRKHYTVCGRSKKIGKYRKRETQSEKQRNG